MDQRKFFVIDTSVLLYDMTSIHSFPDNDVIIPIVVLDELDRFKEKPGLLGESARYVNRYLDTLRSLGNLSEGILIEETGQTIRVELRAPKSENIEGLDWSYGDNKIIACSLFLQKENKDSTVKVITKDINLRVKCDAVGLEAEDYFKDHLETEEEWSGWRNIELSEEEINSFYESGNCSLKDHSLNENEFVVGVNGQQSLLGIYKNGRVMPLNQSISGVINLIPRNKEQKFAIEALIDKSISLVTLTGLAGSGKTFLSLMAALEGIHSGEYDRIVFTRSIQPVGKEIGYLPGDMMEKMEPWLAPIADNIRHAFKETTYFEMMLEKGKIEIAPLSFIRGRTFPNSFILVDESQNASIHELKTIVTRVGEDSKIVLLGDTDQIDTPYITKRSNGLSIVTEKFKDSHLHAHVHLPRGQRSNLATEASRRL